jgi:P2 family phage contractile tail tube protein
MAASDVLKNFNLFVDGKGQAGKVEEVNPPKLTLKTEEFRAGGMDAPIEITMGMEKLESDFSMVSFDREVLSLFGVREGAVVPFVLRGALESMDGTITPIVHTMRGKIKEIDQGTTKAGDKPTLKVSLALTYYKLQHGDTTVHEVDVENMVRVVNGVDALASTRSALGI